MKQESETANKIKRYLDLGAADLKAGTAYRLQQARAVAVARLTESESVSATEVAYARAGAGALRHGGRPRGFSPAMYRWLGVALIAVTAAFGWQQWRALQQVNELQELDTQILSSDLPIDAYLDRGFQNWLKTSFEH